MMKSREAMAVAVRKGKSIKIKKEKLRSRKKVAKIPFARGVVELYDVLILGIKALLWSADVAAGEEEKLSTTEIVLTLLFSLAATIVIFIIIPFFLTKLLASQETFAFALIDGVFRVGAFLLYVVAIGFMKDVRRLFQYHGAEHKTIYCYENRKKLIPRNVRPFPRLHPRCGTSFIIIVAIISIFVFSLIRSPSILVGIGARVVLLPVIAGIGYEVLRFSAKHSKNFLMKLVIQPGLWVQLLTTKEPTTKQIEVAIAALKGVTK